MATVKYLAGTLCFKLRHPAPSSVSRRFMYRPGLAAGEIISPLNGRTYRPAVWWLSTMLKASKVGILRDAERRMACSVSELVNHDERHVMHRSRSWSIRFPHFAWSMAVAVFHKQSEANRWHCGARLIGL